VVDRVPTSEGVVGDVVEVIFRGRGKEVAELEVMQGTMEFQVCIMKFEEVIIFWLVGGLIGGKLE
jgi:hypothetical protein